MLVRDLDAVFELKGMQDLMSKRGVLFLSRHAIENKYRPVRDVRVRASALAVLVRIIKFIHVGHVVKNAGFDFYLVGYFHSVIMPKKALTRPILKGPAESIPVTMRI